MASDKSGGSMRNLLTTAPGLGSLPIGSDAVTGYDARHASYGVTSRNGTTVAPVVRPLLLDGERRPVLVAGNGLHRAGRGLASCRSGGNYARRLPNLLRGYPLGTRQDVNPHVP